MCGGANNRRALSPAHLVDGHGTGARGRGQTRPRAARQGAHTSASPASPASPPFQADNRALSRGGQEGSRRGLGEALRHFRPLLSSAEKVPESPHRRTCGAIPRCVGPHPWLVAKLEAYLMCCLCRGSGAGRRGGRRSCTLRCGAPGTSSESTSLASRASFVPSGPVPSEAVARGAAACRAGGHGRTALARSGLRRAVHKAFLGAGGSSSASCIGRYGARIRPLGCLWRWREQLGRLHVCGRRCTAQ